MTVEAKAEAAVSQQEEPLKVAKETEKVVEVEAEVKKENEAKPRVVEKSSSFKEESNFFSDLKEHEKKALNELKSKLEEAILGNNLFKKDEPKEEEKPKIEENEATPVKEDVEETEKTKPEGDDKEKEAEKCEEKEKPEEGSVEVVKPQEGEEEKKPVEKKGLNELKSKLKEAFMGHNLFWKKSPKKEVEEKEKPKTEEKEGEEGEAPVKEEAKTKEELKPEACQEGEAPMKEEAEKKEELKLQAQDGEDEKNPEAEVEVIKTEEVQEEKKTEECVEVDKDISLWGVPLLPSKGAEGTDVVLLKFLRAREFKVNEAFEMLKKALEWRKEWKIDSILDEDLGNDLALAAYMSGVDRQGHPICYNIFGVLDNEELYQKTFGSQEKRDFFLRWRFQLMEKGIQKLDLKPTGVSSLLQINDLKNFPGPSKKEVRVAIKQAVGLLQDNYPEFVARNIFINVPFWYYAFHALLSPFLTQRTKSKFVVARPAKVTEVLLKYIPIEEIPIQYGGLKRENDFEFSTEDGVASELVIKAGSTSIIEVPAPEVGTTFVWDLTVLGWEVNYKEEFVPTDDCSYTIIVQKGKKWSSNEGPVHNTFRPNEPGKIVLTVENSSSKKKKVFYRHKVKKSAF